MNLGLILGSAMQAVPVAVAGIELLHKEAPGATKEQLALDSLTVLTSAAAAAVPSAQPLTQEVNSVFAALIKLTVAGFNAAGTFTHKAAS